MTGEWYHAAATFDGTAWKIYLNGELDGEVATTATPRSDSIQHAALGAALTIGWRSAGAFYGIIDEARIWNVARTEAEIQAGMQGPLAVGTGLVARWGMDEATGSTINSYPAASTVEGTLTNGASFVFPGTPYRTTSNSSPDAPTLVAPADLATDVELDPTLQVSVSDPDGDDVTATFFGREVGAPVGEDFTFVVLPDTQHYVDADEARAEIYAGQTQWIADNAGWLNVAFVSHLGDVVQNADANDIEWQRADTAMDILDNAGIPNNLAPGNHDLGSSASTYVLYDTYFPPMRYDLPANPWYGGWLGEEAGQADHRNKDNYELFTAGGIDFLIIHLEVDMPTAAVAWAEEIIDRFPNRQVIISTHAFLTAGGSRGTSLITGRSDGLTAEQVWTQLIDPNCNIFMVVNGHYNGENSLTSTNSCGQPVHQIVTDYQERPNGGDGWMRFYVFRPSENQIEAYTYSPDLGTFEFDSNSQFVLNYNMTDLGGFEEIGSETVASGATASTTWSSLAPGETYEWYAAADDGTLLTTSETWSFSTAVLPPVVGSSVGFSGDDVVDVGDVRGWLVI